MENTDVNNGDVAQETITQQTTDQDKNWAEARRVIEEQARELAEFRKQAQKPKEEPQEDYSFDDLDYVSRKQLEKERERIRKEATEEVFKRLDEQKRLEEERNLPQTLKKKFSDFDQVCSKENLDLLIKTKPELVASIEKVPDKKAQAILAYEAIKASLGNKTAQEELDEKQMERNLQKPPHSSAAGSNPLKEANAFANGLNADKRRELYAEMRKFARGA